MRQTENYRRGWIIRRFNQLHDTLRRLSVAAEGTQVHAEVAKPLTLLEKIMGIPK
jgi:hypothetical protein